MLLDTNTEQADDPMNRTSSPNSFASLPGLVEVVLDEECLRSLPDLRDGDRPTERSQTSQIDVHKQKGVLATDLIGGTPIAMEIRVVASSVGSNSDWLFCSRNAGVFYDLFTTVVPKTAMCRFCICMTHCPLDLFKKPQVPCGLGGTRATRRQHRHAARRQCNLETNVRHSS
ncbi:uncharacterized protein EDB91DRAFT_229353 [Suillus paluster]|uniref:uncharacterized protein n=1 Tax=Suillus paluster TaxID=48578 RepID=UPI001B86D5BB|nr:uncharacterized protein EDB91DRAFT_229353 [Suillus paluster]KAG1721865.1 hypothetical protein EDB91DRAFT_229353 [Suillus paluster]